jgi:hypothetical protein
MGITFVSTDTDPTAGALEPVLLEFARHHPFDGPKKKNARCRVCKRGQHWIEHLGYPEPLATDSGTDPLAWQAQKRMWQEVFGEALHHSGLPREPVESVQVTARYVFDRRVRRDRDNLVYPLCKFLGDTLVRGRYWTLPYEAIDWTDAGRVDSRKLHRRLLDPGRVAMVESDAMKVYAYAQHTDGTARLVGRTFETGKPVPVVDPLGGWIEDDRWDRFEVIDMQAVYVKDREALELMILPSTVVPPEWPPELTEG